MKINIDIEILFSTKTDILINLKVPLHNGKLTRPTVQLSQALR